MISRPSRFAFGLLVAAFLGSMLPCCPLLAQSPATQPALTIVNETAAFGGRRTNMLFQGHSAFIILPAVAPDDAAINWVWFAPTFQNKYPRSRHRFIIEHLLAAHMAMAGIDVGESYGSPDGTQLYAGFHDAIVQQFHLNPSVVLLPQSRGGLMLYNWATLHPDQVVRIAGIYPVCDLRSYPGLDKAAPAYHLTAAQLNDELARHNPIDLLAPLAAAHVPILHMHGDADKVVPLQQNSAEMAKRYKALGGTMTLIIIHGHGHEEIDPFFANDAFVNFLTTGQTPPQ